MVDEEFLVRGERSRSLETPLRPALSRVALSSGIATEAKASHLSVMDRLYETRSFIQSEVGLIMMFFPCRSGQPFEPSNFLTYSRTF